MLELATVAEAAVIRCAARPPRPGMLLDRTQMASEAHDVLFLYRHGERRRGICLSRMREALSRATTLPRRVTQASDLPVVVKRHFAKSHAVEDQHCWMRRRGRAIWGYDLPDGQLRSFYAHVRALFRALPHFVALSMRSALNAWLTTKRMSGHPGWCVLDCQAA